MIYRAKFINNKSKFVHISTNQYILYNNVSEPYKIGQFFVISDISPWLGK